METLKYEGNKKLTILSCYVIDNRTRFTSHLKHKSKLNKNYETKELLKMDLKPDF